MVNISLTYQPGNFIVYISKQLLIKTHINNIIFVY